MAVKKEKVIELLKEKLKGKGYGKTFMENFAVRHAPKIETDEDIEEYLDDRLEDLVDGDKEADRRATAAANKAKREAADTIIGKKPGEDDDDKTPPPADDPTMPAWAKGLLASVTKLGETVSSIQTEKTVNTIKERFLKDERLKGIDPVLLEGRIPTKEEDFDQYVETAATALKGYVKAEEPGDQGRGGNIRVGDKPRVVGKRASGDAKPAVATEAELKDVLSGIKI